MGYRSEVALCLTRCGKLDLDKMLEKVSRKTRDNVCDLLANSDRHLTDSKTASELWFWDWIKWYQDSPEITFMEELLNRLDRESFLFIRIGEDPDDSEVKGIYWENPFGLDFSRSIEFS